MADLKSLVEGAENAVRNAVMQVGKLVDHLEREDSIDLRDVRHVEGALYAAHNLLGDLAPLVLESAENEDD